MNAEAYLGHVAAALEPVLAAALADPAVPGELAPAMRHSVLGGGKRLRPALCLAAATACGVPDAVPRLLPAGAALELLHTYSLIHDDLPEMDDAATRRGLPTCHRVFGGATALLAGDALQALAFDLLARPLPGVAGADQLAAVAALARAAGPAGMCGGQALDLVAAAAPPDDAGLWRLQMLKTGALLAAAVDMGALLAHASDARRAALAAYAAELGRAFQITDDVLDVTGAAGALGKETGGDASRGKVTVVSRFGLDAARAMARAAAGAAGAALAGMGAEADILRTLARFAAARER